MTKPKLGLTADDKPVKCWFSEREKQNVHYLTVQAPRVERSAPFKAKTIPLAPDLAFSTRPGI